MADRDPLTFDLEHYAALPRVGGLVLSPDGRRLVTAVASLSPDGTTFVTSLWELDPAGDAEPRRITRSAPGESRPAFLPTGDLLFTSARPDPEVADAERDDEVAGLWLLPAAGGEARQVLSLPGGIDGVAVAAGSGTVAYTAQVLPGAETPEQDRDLRKARKDAKVTALLHDGYPIRYWDHDLGPAERRLHAGDAPRREDDRLGDPHDLTPSPGRALDEQEFALTPDGSELIVGWTVDEGRAERRVELVALGTATGSRRVLASESRVAFQGPAVAPDGVSVACVRASVGDYSEPPDHTLWLVDLSTGVGRDLLPDFPLWPGRPVWTPDGSALLFTADEDGRSPIFRLDLAPGTLTRLSADGAFSDLCVAPDGDSVYALRSSYTSPPGAVRLDATGADQTPVELPTPGLPLDLPGQVEELATTAADGTRLRAWLVLPPGASPDDPAPLVLWVHGGPLSSWNAWSWRWCPHLLVERGYAVLLPDPALSSGYGQDFVRRGWGTWGAAPYTDLMTITDAALQRPDLDAERTAAMGGSFGGYMANWIATQTERFRCIVTHASLYAMDQFAGTTDDTWYWELEFGDPRTQPERYAEYSPHRFAERIRTPMLVVHGERDFRVPIGEALRLWSDLVRLGVPARYLFFPDENHWVLKPNNARLWYDTVLAFLDEHVLGKDFVRPALV